MSKKGLGDEKQNFGGSSELSLNEKIKDLDKKVEWFYSGDFELEKASERYQEALELSTEIEKDLQTLKNKIEVLDIDFSKPI